MPGGITEPGETTEETVRRETLEEAGIELGGRRIFLVHYPHYARALAATGDWDLVCCGHSHHPGSQGKAADHSMAGDASAEARAHAMGVELNVAGATFMDDQFTFVDCPGSVEFTSESRAALPACDAAIVYPVAVGLVSAAHAILLPAAMHAFLHALVSNWISAGARLIPLGQTDSQRVLAALEPLVVSTAARALGSGLDDLASATFRADLASLRHETQYTRLFRS